MDAVASSIDTNKPDVIFAHSDGGAAVLSALLYRSCTVKCLVLISCIPPFDRSGSKRLDISLSGIPLIHTPTLFIYGEKDPLAHFVNLTKELVSEENLVMYSWDGGHSVPNSGQRGVWEQVARKTVEIVNKV